MFFRTYIYAIVYNGFEAVLTQGKVEVWRGNCKELPPESGKLYEKTSDTYVGGESEAGGNRSSRGRCSWTRVPDSIIQ